MDKIRQESEKSECSFAELSTSHFPNFDLAEVIVQVKGSFQQLEESFSPADKLTHLLTALKQIIHLVSCLGQCCREVSP